MKRIQFFIETSIFGVCTKIGHILGLPTGIIRLYFIYTAFITFGSPVFIYLFLAFWMKVKDHLRNKILRLTNSY